MSHPWLHVLDSVGTLSLSSYMCTLKTIQTTESPIRTPSTTNVHITNAKGRTGLLWSSIGLAVFNSLLQGLVTTVVTIAEDQGMWTFRFRIARFEHWWWSTISCLLSTSFALIVLSFLSGNSNDSVGVLALSTASAIAIVRYAIPAWRNRKFIENRWLAWTGASRTSIPARFAPLCGNVDHWLKLAAQNEVKRVPPASDDWGFALKADPGIAQDPTAILEGMKAEIDADLLYSPHWPIGPCVYDDGIHGDTEYGTISLLWGPREGFRRRVSRAINSMPATLLLSRPRTVDGYGGEGLCLAMGILGRNKGLDPRELVFDFDDRQKKERGIKRRDAIGSTSKLLEDTSQWAPRPNKVMRSYYTHAMEEQFGTLLTAYVAAAAELALILLDCSPGALAEWLGQRHEQQSMEVNQHMSRPEVSGSRGARATSGQLYTLYRAQYVSMIISLNYYQPSGTRTNTPSSPRAVVRPDLHCFALLYLAEHAVQRGDDQYVEGTGVDKPDWWTDDWVRARLNAEAQSLVGDKWKQAAAWLLGLPEFPPQLSDPPAWPSLKLQPEYERKKG